MLTPMTPMSRMCRPVVLAVLVAGLAGCNRVKPVEVLEPVDVTTGWYDAGILEDGKNKLVPSVSLKLRNKSSEPIDGVQINAIFRRVNEAEMWGEHYGWAVKSVRRWRRARPPPTWSCARRLATPASSRACRSCSTRSSSTRRWSCI